MAQGPLPGVKCRYIVKFSIPAVSYWLRVSNRLAFVPFPTTQQLQDGTR